MIFSLITQESFFLAWVVGFLFYSLHLTLDFLTASKVPIFYPIIKRRIRFFIDRAINIILATISGSIILFYFITFFLWPSLYFSPLIEYILGFYITYFFYRIITKIWVQFRLPKKAYYIPGIFPLTYLIYYNQSSEDELSFKLERKLQFRKRSSVIYQSNIKKNSKEEKLFIQALEECKKYVFFLKWEYIIPLFKENGKSLDLYLVLTESYFSGSFYSIKIQFDKDSNEIVHLKDGFTYKNSK
jgi:hypothetical protein